ncbi:hypothetical protein [Synechocystis sp. LKSZ1]|uniref:hypothetical protein n=1 Tax=Synechocystis sp. LKSZ1 TaxID=3144951 RepID=UPI00336C16DD
MTRHYSTGAAQGKLSVGDIVTGGLRIYRDHFKNYFGEAFRAYLWVFVPVYGWAKFLAIQGLLGRLAFQEAQEQPESILEARRQVMPKLWYFLVASIAMGLFLMLALLGFVIVGILVGVIAGLLFSGLGGGNFVISALLVLGVMVFVIAFFFGYIWLYSRLSLTEICLAIEPNLKPMEAIQRSWQLTKGYVFSLQLVFFIAVLITIPISIVSNLGTLVTAIIGEGEEFASLIDLPLTLLFGALLIPFWQAVKAVAYFDLRVRKEGLNLSLEMPGYHSPMNFSDEETAPVDSPVTDPTKATEETDLAILNHLMKRGQASFMDLLMKLKCDQKILKSRLLALEEENMIVIVEQLDDENTIYKIR